jgi:inositol phosphorylceramide synthase catalytic subunit
MPKSISPEVALDERSWIRTVALHVGIVLGLTAFTIHGHYRGEYVALTVFWAVLTAAGPRARRFASMAIPVLCVGILYDQIVPLFLQFRPDVHVSDLYHLELRLFPIHTVDGTITAPEWFAKHTSPWLDIPCGFSYMAYMFETFIVIAWLFLARDEERGSRLAWAFLLVNILGMTSWILCPAAPPWYVAQYGLGPAHLDALPSAAGAARFDALLGIHFFSGFYSRNHDVFGAMPSLHCAYPILVMLSCWTLRSKAARIAVTAFAALVCFSAVYLNHHYIVDAIAGAVTGTVAFVVTSVITRRRPGIA